MSKYTEGWDGRYLATYQTLLKRALRRATRLVDNDTSTAESVLLAWAEWALFQEVGK